LSWLAGATTTAQDIDEASQKKNAFSLSVLAPLNRTFSFSYARRLKHGREITITPLYQHHGSDIATEPAVDKGSNNRFLGFLNPDPNWYYSNFMLRTGLRIPIGGGVFAYEPQVQLGYGQFLNKVIKTADPEGDAYDEYLRLDRKYFSLGIVSMVNWVKDYKYLRLKWFVGFGIHARRYDDTIWNHYTWYRDTSQYYDLSSEPYYKRSLTFHLGMEVGLRY
jgi:hypothetical protein